MLLNAPTPEQSLLQYLSLFPLLYIDALRLKELIVLWGEKNPRLCPSFIFIHCQAHTILMRTLAHQLSWSKTTCCLLLISPSARYGAHLAPRDPPKPNWRFSIGPWMLVRVLDGFPSSCKGAGNNMSHPA